MKKIPASKKGADKMEEIKNKRGSLKSLFGFGDKKEEEEEKKSGSPGLDKDKVKGFKKGFFGK